MNMKNRTINKQLVKFFTLSLINISSFSNKVSTNIKNSNIKLPKENLKNLEKKQTINFTEEDIPHNLREIIKDKYPHLAYNQQINKCYFLLITNDFFLKSPYFEKIKNEFEKYKKEDNFYYNYYLLLFLIKKIIIKDSSELLKQQYKITKLENDAKFQLNVTVLKDVTEEEFHIINNFIKEQQSQDFKLNNTIVKNYNEFISKKKNIEHKTMTVEDVLLEGDYMNFINLPKEFLAISNLLKKYNIWFTWQKRNINSYEIGIIRSVEKLPTISYQEFIKDLENQLILKEIMNIINNKTNITYKINNQLPLEVLDEEIFEYLTK